MNSDSGMLYACVVKLYAANDGKLPATQGHHAHAAFLDIVRAVDPTLAQALHGSSGRKPFTVSPLQGLPAPHEGKIVVKAGQTAWLRFTMLVEPLFRAFIGRFLQSDARPTIRLSRVEFAVGEVLTTPGSHPWASYTTAQELLDRWRERDMRGRNNPAHTFTLEFASPTAWSLGGRWGKRIEVLPRPRLFFGGLATTWDAWFKDVFRMDSRYIRDYAAETVVVSRMQLETRMYQYRGYKQVGTVGTLTYELLDYANEHLVRVLNTLADFAFYAGVGYKTTMGMGQVRRVVS